MEVSSEMDFIKNFYLKEVEDRSNLQVYGFIINDSFLYHISSMSLIMMDVSRESSKERKKTVRLRKTMSLLFVYLLRNAGEVISDVTLLREVWEKNDLKGTHHRLWEVITALNKILKSVGISTDLILRINSSGYMINKKRVALLYLS